MNNISEKINGMGAPIVLIFGDEPKLCGVLKSLVQMPYHAEIVNSVDAAMEALESIGGISSLIIDAKRTDSIGLDVAERFRQKHKSESIVVIGSVLRQGIIKRAFQIGALFICKPLDTKDYMRIQGIVMGWNPSGPPPRGTILETSGLSHRQSEILELLITGMDRQAICDVLAISKSTLKWHIRELLARTGYKNLTLLVCRLLLENSFGDGSRLNLCSRVHSNAPSSETHGNPNNKAPISTATKSLKRIKPVPQVR